MRLDTRLTRGKTKEQVDLIKEQYASAKNLLNQLIKVLTNELEDGIIGTDEEEVYEKANVLLILAGRAGERRAIRKALNLLNPVT